MKFPATHLLLLPVALSVMLAACDKNKPDNSSKVSGPTLFEQISAEKSGISFSNSISETNEMNNMTFNYIYMSGGAGVGDFNNDGLPDVYFAATLGPSKIYLNKGNFIFEDISENWE